MKTLVIYTNKLQFENIVDDNNQFDIFLDKNCYNINDLYKKCPKIYCYYLFLDSILELSIEDINNILKNLMNFKPAIYYLNNNIKIFHRSVIHYLFPLSKYNQYINYTYNIQKIVEFPLKKYILNYDKKFNNLFNVNDIKWRALLRWFLPALKYNIEYYTNIYDNYEIINEEIDKINFLNTFDIFKFFNINHEYFQEKRIKFHKNNKELYGNCGTYHFNHDFHNINRNSIVNHLIKKYSYNKYLEIGVYNCYHFNDVIINEKYGVDPSPKIDGPVFKIWDKNIYRKTSIQFFKDLDVNEKYDIIFIDGCLYEYNVMSDVINSLNHLTENGTIVLHDCNPPIEYLQRDNYRSKYNGSIENKIIWNNRTYTDRHWVGKVWKIITKLRTERDDLEVSVVDCDWGVGIIRKGKQELFNMVEDKDELYKYDTFIKYRRYMLNLISPEKFLDLY